VAVRALTGAEPTRADDSVDCPRCGAAMDFDAPDPRGVGRTMQRCTSPRCPDRVLRAVPVRRV